MSHKPYVVIGAQWGDEGKGKLVDALSKDYDIVGRFNGGNNAGHTIIYNQEAVKLHVLPSGVFQKKQLLIAQGAVFDPAVLLEEITFCKKNHLPLKLLIDYRVNIVMPYHKLIDAANEQWKGKKATGSLHLGIGYCYEDRNNRAGIRCEDLLYPKILKEKIFIIFPLKKAIIEKAYGMPVSITAQEIYNQTLKYAKQLKPFLADVSNYVWSNLKTKKILFEGANGFMLDGQFGSVPYTVACNTIVPSVPSSVGFPVTQLHSLGVVKAYTTRVGAGPFPTEQINTYGEIMQQVGKEIGSTSGRKRRCGWLDLCILRYAQRINNFTEIAITKLDILSEFDEIPVCVGYMLRGKIIREYPSITHDFYLCKPIYKILKGWKKDISHVKTFGLLPKEAKAYITFVGKQMNVRVKLVSVSPEREGNIFL